MAPWNPNNKYSRVTVTANIPADKSWEDFNLETLRVRLNPAYMIFGKETAKTGQKHYQGYLEFSKRTKGSTLMNHFSAWGIKAHLEPAMGTCTQNEKYCEKEDPTPFKFGKPTGNEGQGTRVDLGSMFQLVKEGASVEDLVDKSPQLWAQYRKAMDEYRQVLQPVRNFPSKLVFLWGPTGFGKTAHAQELSPETVFFRDPFVQGFTGAKKNVLFDDFDWKKMSPKYWLTLCDRYPMVVEVKGATKNWAPEVICFTSNDDPKTWWPDAPPETRAAIHRRMAEFGTIKHLSGAVPVGQKMLTEFLPAASSAAAESTVAAAPLTAAQAASSLIALSEQPSGPDPEVVDLTQDSDDESLFDAEIDSDREWDNHSDHSNTAYRRAVKRARHCMATATQRCPRCELKCLQCICD